MIDTYKQSQPIKCRWQVFCSVACLIQQSPLDIEGRELYKVGECSKAVGGASMCSEVGRKTKLSESFMIVKTTRDYDDSCTTLGMFLNHLFND